MTISTWVGRRWPLSRKARESAVRKMNPVFRKRIGIEALESRTLPSAIPVFATYNESNPPVGNTPGISPLAQVTSVPTVPLHPLELTVVTGTLPANDPGNVVAISLQAGELVVLSAQTKTGAISPFTLELENTRGQVLASSTGVTLDPDTGQPGTGPCWSIAPRRPGATSSPC